MANGMHGHQSSIYRQLAIWAQEASRPLSPAVAEAVCKSKVIAKILCSMQGLPWLLEAYPDAQLACHEAEARFVTGGGQFAELEGDSLIFALGKYTQGVNSSMPAHRALVLQARLSSNNFLFHRFSNH